MPRKSEHIKAAKVLLGFSDPIIHELLDSAIVRLGPKHRYWTHNVEYLKSIEILFGEKGRLEAVLHLLQDWGMITKEDYSFSTRSPRRV